MILPLVRSVGRMGIGAGTSFSAFLVHMYQITLLAWRTITCTPLWVKNLKEGFHQMRILGVQSLALVMSVSTFVGAEVVVQAEFQFSGVIPLRFLGFAVFNTIISEFAPVITSVVVAGRIAASMAAEISNMKSTEQLDAMTCLNLDHTRYLVLPRVVASIVMMPVLVVFADLVAVGAAIVTTALFVDITLYQFISSMKWYFSAADLLVGTFKCSIFGCLVALVGCYSGFVAERGAQGTGEAASKAVVLSCVLILVADFVVAFLML